MTTDREAFERRYFEPPPPTNVDRAVAAAHQAARALTNPTIPQRLRDQAGTHLTNTVNIACASTTSGDLDRLADVAHRAAELLYEGRTAPRTADALTAAATTAQIFQPRRKALGR